jgi:hypothetical protein
VEVRLVDPAAADQRGGVLACRRVVQIDQAMDLAANAAVGVA